MSGPHDTSAQAPSCRTCGCTEDDCAGCIAKTGEPCHWVAEGLCSACATPEQRAVAHVLELADVGMAASNELAQILADYAQPPRNELGMVVSHAVQLFQQLDLSGAPAAELRRWAGLAAVVAAAAAQVANACVQAIARPEAAASALRPAPGAGGPAIPASGGPPLIVTPDGRPAGAAAAAPALVGSHLAALEAEGDRVLDGTDLRGVEGVLRARGALR